MPTPRRPSVCSLHSRLPKKKYLGSSGLATRESTPSLEKSGPQTQIGVVADGDQTQIWTGRVRTLGARDQASRSRLTHPNPRVRSQGKPRQGRAPFKPARGGTRGPGAREEVTRRPRRRLHSQEPHGPHVRLGSSLTAPARRLLIARPHSPEFTANSVAILEAH